MSEIVHYIALLGCSNSGKTTLFNQLTGYRQKVANYGGVTVDYKLGALKSELGHGIQIIDLPGTYSLHPISPDEAITCQLITAKGTQGKTINKLLCVLDATNLELHLRFALQVKALGKPTAFLINRLDVAKDKGIHINLEALQTSVASPVFVIHNQTIQKTDALNVWLNQTATNQTNRTVNALSVNNVLKASVSYITSQKRSVEDRLDPWVLHPIWGFVILGSLTFLMFQCLFIIAEPFKDFIEQGIATLGVWVTSVLPSSSLLKSLVNEGIFLGLGTVCAFCPQLLLLFALILILEESGYLPRAAFLLDQLLNKVGLTGRAFIPLLSSFACTIPSIMATRTIQNPRDRLVTILIAPLITCSARLPIYTLLISAFIPAKRVLGFLNLQGIVLFSLYFLGIGSALLVAWIMKKLQNNTVEPILLMEIPPYQLPSFHYVILELWDKLNIFLSRIGTIILALTVLLWFLCRFPLPPNNANHPAIYYSAAGYIGRYLAIIFHPIGFNWSICIALVPGLIAREVAISALCTVYAISSQCQIGTTQLTTLIANQWSLATALSLLTWYVFAPQCLSTLTVIKQETNSWNTMIFATAYLFALAYSASFLTYHVARLW